MAPPGSGKGILSDYIGKNTAGIPMATNPLHALKVAPTGRKKKCAAVEVQMQVL
jgi:hypothetical protein